MWESSKTQAGGGWIALECSLISMFIKETSGKRRKVEFWVDNYIGFKMLFLQKD